MILDKRNAAGDIIDLPRIDLFPGKKGEVANTVQFWAVTNQVSHIVRQLQRARIEVTVLSGVYYGGPPFPDLYGGWNSHALISVSPVA